MDSFMQNYKIKILWKIKINMYFNDNERLRKSNKGIRLVLKTFIDKILFYEFDNNI